MIEFKHISNIPADFTGICKVYSNNSAFRNNTTSIRYYKNGKLHNENGPAIKWVDDKIDWYYEGVLYGYDIFYTNEAWLERVRELKLQIFK